MNDALTYTQEPPMTAAVNVNDLTFGVELEVTLPAGTCPVGGYHQGVQVPQLPPGWKAERDASIQPAPGYIAAEIVSPVLRGADGLRQLKAVCDWLNGAGARVNRSTGFHVHVGFSRSDKRALRRLVCLVANFEKALFAATGTRSREEGAYCRPVQSDDRYQQAFRDAAVPANCLPRYHVLNLANLLRGSKPTVEFRVFAGTTNATKAIGHVLTCLGLVEKALALKKLPKWVAKTPVETSPIHRSGEGQTALTRLFYSLGWTKGREDHTFGDIQPEGLPTIEAIKKELMRLARKYDRRTEEQERPEPGGGSHGPPPPLSPA
jgi:hypothetical protein